MAYITKEQFEEILKERYDNLSKQDFAILVNTTKDKISDLIKSKDIILEKNPDEEDDFIITYSSSEFYERVFGVFRLVSMTRRLSFKQYKCLSAFVSAKIGKQEEFKQF
jgi:E3 ubiquitin-protein ligase DOA10